MSASLSLVVLLLAAQAPTKPSLAVFPLEAKTGVNPQTAELLTESIVDEVRRTGAFSRVVSSKEIEAVLGVEKQRQLLQCDAEGCIAELAGSLGVDFVMTGSAGHVGEFALLNLRIVSMKSAQALSSVSARQCADSDGNLLRVVNPSVLHLLHQGGLLAGPLAGGSLLVAECGPRAAAPAAASSEKRVDAAPALAPTPSEDSSSSPALPIAGALGGGAVLAALLGATAAVLGVVGLGLLRLPAVLNAVDTPGLQNTSRVVALYAVPGASLSFAAVMLLGTFILGVVAIAAAAVGLTSG